MTAPARNSDGNSDLPALIPQANGRGALYAGGVKGNRGGPGATPSRIRAALRKDFVRESRPLLRAIQRGDYVHKMKLPLAVILEHALCPECDGRMEAREGARGDLELDVMASAPIKERRLAAEAIARFGLGEANQQTTVHPEVVGRIQGTVQAIQDYPGLTQEQREGLLDAVEAVWA